MSNLNENKTNSELFIILCELNPIFNDDKHTDYNKRQLLKFISNYKIDESKSVRNVRSSAFTLWNERIKCLIKDIEAGSEGLSRQQGNSFVYSAMDFCYINNLNAFDNTGSSFMHYRGLAPYKGDDGMLKYKNEGMNDGIENSSKGFCHKGDYGMKSQIGKQFAKNGILIECVYGKSKDGNVKAERFGALASCKDALQLKNFESLGLDAFIFIRFPSTNNINVLSQYAGNLLKNDDIHGIETRFLKQSHDIIVKNVKNSKTI